MEQSAVIDKIMPRFHDSCGQRVPLHRLPNGARSLWQVFRRRWFGIYPELPWIPFAAIRKLERIIDRDSTIWEIGAGMSTVWFSRRAKKITSVEADKSWHEKLSRILIENQVTNVDLRFEWVAGRMEAFTDVADNELDLLFIDGGPRSECLIHGFAKVKPRGYIYLDNWDVAAFWLGADSFLKRHSNGILSRESIVDYVPGNFAVNEGLLLQKRPK